MIKLKSLLFENATKMIVYHGTGEKIRRFSLKKSTMGIIWFTSDKDKILKKEVGASGHGYIITAEVTINKPAGWKEYNDLLLVQLRQDGYDGAILPSGEGNHFDCFVFSPTQIKILKIEQV